VQSTLLYDTLFLQLQHELM